MRNVFYYSRRFMIINVCFLVLLTSINNTVLADEFSQLGTINQPVVLSFLPNQGQEGKAREAQYYKQLLAAITARYGVYFVIQQSKSYEDAVNDFCAGKTHIAALGAVTYNEAKRRCRFTKLLAVEVRNGESIYFSGIFTHKKHAIDDVKQLKNKTLALGNQHSTSSFNYPLAMLIDEGLQPEHDFKKIWVMENPAYAIEKLAKGEVFAAAASFKIWKESIDKNTINPIYFKPLMKSEPIPNPPLVINNQLPKALKEKIKQAFTLVHTWENSEKILNFF